MIHQLSRFGIFMSVTALLTFAGCKKDEAKPEAPVTEAPGKTEAPSEPPVTEEEPATPAEPEQAGDYFYVEIAHAEPKEGDPVKVNFPAMRVVSASFDPKTVVGGKAEIEIDLSQIDSGIPKRDGHLASPDYFDSAKHPKATIKVSDVKAKEGKTFSASAEVTLRGITKTWPVEFNVVETSETGITIEAEHNFSRLDFEIGKAEGDSTAAEVLGKLRVTLNNG